MHDACAMETRGEMAWIRSIFILSPSITLSCFVRVVLFALIFCCKRLWIGIVCFSVELRLGDEACGDDVVVTMAVYNCVL